MQSRYAVAALAATGVMLAAADVPDRAPVVAEDPAGEIERCRRSWSKNGRISGEVAATVWVGANGRVTGVSTPPDADPLAAQAAQCAVLGMKYQPALRGGQPVAGNLVVPVGFITPPQLKRLPDRLVWERCYPHAVRNEGMEGRIDVEVTVDPKGKAVQSSVPDDTEPWLAKAAKCMVPRVDFLPGLDKGVPVTATMKLPLYFKLVDWDVNLTSDVISPTVAGFRRNEPDRERPAPVSPEAEIIAAYRDCYPPDHQGSAEVIYQIRIEVSGVVRKVDVVESSGDARLDEAGSCILRKLKFRPTIVNGRAITDTLQWPLLVRPPPAAGE